MRKSRGIDRGSFVCASRLRRAFVEVRADARGADRQPGGERGDAEVVSERGGRFGRQRDRDDFDLQGPVAPNSRACGALAKARSNSEMRATTLSLALTEPVSTGASPAVSAQGMRSRVLRHRVAVGRHPDSRGRGVERPGVITAIDSRYGSRFRTSARRAARRYQRKPHLCAIFPRASWVNPSRSPGVHRHACMGQLNRCGRRA